MSKSCVSVLAAALLLFSSLPANAVQWTYPGTMCTDVDEVQLKVSRHPIYGVYNTASAPAIVECPLPVYGGTGPSLSTADINVYNRNPNYSLGCYLYAFDAWGDVLFASYQLTTVSSAAMQSFNFDLSGVTGDDFVGFQCTIPPPGSMGYSHVARYTTTD